MKTLNKIVALGILGAGLVQTAHALPTYTLTNLGTLGGNYSAAYGINEAGQIVGTSCITSGCNSLAPDSKYRATLWNGGSITNLGFTGVARAINNNGEVVGETGTGFARPQYPNGRAFYWNNSYASGTYRDLGTLYSNGSGGYNGYSGAFDITDSGVVTGFAYTSNSYPNGDGTTPVSTYSRGFVARSDNNFVMEDMGCVDSNYACYSRGQGINESLEIAGRATDTDFDGNKHGTYWNWDSSNPAPQFLPPLNQAYSTMEDINEAGLIAGVSSSEPSGVDLQATLWTDSGNGYSATVLTNAAGFSNSYAWALNDDGTAVGYMQNGGIATRRAFVYLDGAMVDLNSLILAGAGSAGFSYLDTAYDINNQGQIVGFGKLSNGQYSAFLLTPEVPVPPAFGLFLSSILALVARKKITAK